METPGVSDQQPELATRYFSTSNNRVSCTGYLSDFRSTKPICTAPAPVMIIRPFLNTFNNFTVNLEINKPFWINLFDFTFALIVVCYNTCLPEFEVKRTSNHFFLRRFAF